MIKCPSCNSSNLDTSRFCDECGTRLAQPQPQHASQKDQAQPAYVPPAVSADVAIPRSGTPTSIDIPVMPFPVEKPAPETTEKEQSRAGAHAVLVIERGDSPGTEFKLVNDDSTIGRWDADNGVFPDVDLDAYDSDAKVSRRHARIRRHKGSYSIEDLGSTNGTYINRGRRLLPGNAQALNDGDEVIVGKTFLRFQIVH